VSLARQSAVTFVTRMTISLINIPISMVIARGLGAAGQGLYASAITFPDLWAGIGLLGLDAGHLYFVSRDRRNLGPAVANSLLILFAVSLLLLPTYGLLAGPLSGGMGAAFRPYVWLSALVVPLIAARLLTLSLMLGMGRVEAYNGVLVASQVALLIMVALGVGVARGGTGLVIVCYQASLLLFLGLAVLQLRRHVTRDERRGIAPSRALFRDCLGFGLRGHLGTVLNLFSHRFSMIFVLRWLGAAAQGHFWIAIVLAEKLGHIAASVQFVLFPRIAAASREEADRLTPVVCRLTLLTVVLAGIALYALARVLLVLFYSEAYLPALPAFRVLVPGIVVLTISNVLASDFSGRNRRGLLTCAMAFGYAINLALCLVWIRRLGVTGAALAATVSYAAQSALMAVLFWRITGIPPHRLIVPERGDLELARGLWARGRARLRRRRGD
jgi:O-antigen/teichoic acid export membrane protein